MIKTFRGKLEDGDQQRIRLSTKKGKVGYKIFNFQSLGAAPGTGSGNESILKIFKIAQSTVTGTIDFGDGNLLAAIYYSDQDAPTGPAQQITIFEQEVFNQDIYITHTDVDSTNAMNYYLELEVMTLSDNAAVVSTLRDIRLNPQVGA